MALVVKFACLALGAVGIANMYLAIFADVGVMILAVLNAIRCLFVKNLSNPFQDNKQTVKFLWKNKLLRGNI